MVKRNTKELSHISSIVSCRLRIDIRSWLAWRSTMLMIRIPTVGDRGTTASAPADMVVAENSSSEFLASMMHDISGVECVMISSSSSPFIMFEAGDENWYAMSAMCMTCFDR